MHSKGDVELPGWLVEVKYRKSFSVFTPFLELENKANIDGKNALLILTQKGTSIQLAVMRIEYFKEATKNEQAINNHPGMDTAGH